MKIFLALLKCVVISQLAIAGTSQGVLKHDDVIAMQFELPQAEPTYAEYKSILNGYYSSQFTEMEMSTLSRNEMNIKLDKVYKIEKFVDVQNNLYLREVRRLNRKKQIDAIVKAFQNQTDFDIPDTIWVPTCMELQLATEKKEACTRADIVSNKSTTARIAYNSAYWVKLTFELSAIFRISPSNADMAMVYLNEDVSLGANFNDAISKIEQLIENSDDAKTNYLFAAAEDLVIASIKKLENTKVLSVSPEYLRGYAL